MTGLCAEVGLAAVLLHGTVRYKTAKRAKVSLFYYFVFQDVIKVIVNNRKL
jgi:hypothetical protein